MILNLGSKLALNSAHFTRGLVKHAAGRGYFRAVPSQTGDEFVTSPPPPPQSLNNTSASWRGQGILRVVSCQTTRSAARPPHPLAQECLAYSIIDRLRELLGLFQNDDEDIPIVTPTSDPWGIGTPRLKIQGAKRTRQRVR